MYSTVPHFNNLYQGHLLKSLTGHKAYLCAVKIFAFILSCYILCLSTIPCCAVDKCNDKTNQSQTANRHENNDGCKNCSPFALCGNCAGFAIPTNNFQVLTPQKLTQKTLSGDIQSYLPRYISSFWQPPRSC